MKIGFFGVLTLIFITLKLLGNINWPWLWVLAPFWIPAAIALVLLCVVGVIALVEKPRPRNW